MKATAVIVLLALCGAASAANVLQKALRQSPRAQCDISDIANIHVPPDVVKDCTLDIFSGFNPREFCTDDCFGAVCRYWSSKNQGGCATELGKACRGYGASVPRGCGALTLVTIKGVLVALLLLAAFFIL